MSPSDHRLSTLLLVVATTHAAAPAVAQVNEPTYEVSDFQLEYVDDFCSYLLTEPVIDNVGFMMTDGIIRRVDVFPGSSVTTRSGAKIGMTEAEIKGMFGDKIETSGHPYVAGGKYLIFVPVDEQDKNFRVIFETDANGIVTSYRAGRLPEVGWIEGCL